MHGLAAIGYVGFGMCVATMIIVVLQERKRQIERERQNAKRRLARKKSLAKKLEKQLREIEREELILHNQRMREYSLN